MVVVLAELNQRWLPMDFYNPDDWTKLETAFTSAPRWAIMVAASTIGGLIGWSFRGSMSAAQIGSLKEQIAALEQRLKLTAEQAAASDRATDKVEKEFQAYKAEVAAKGRDASPAKVEAALTGLNISLQEVMMKKVEAGSLGRSVRPGVGMPDPKLWQKPR